MAPRASDDGFTWRAFVIDVRAGWAQGSLIEVEPNVLAYIYGAWGPGGGGLPYQMHSQMMRVAESGLEPVSYETQ